MESHASDRLKHRTKTQHDVYVYTHVIFDHMVLSNDTVQGKTQLQNYRKFSENLNHLNLMLSKKCFFLVGGQKTILKNSSQWEGLSHIYMTENKKQFETTSQFF